MPTGGWQNRFIKGLMHDIGLKYIEIWSSIIAIRVFFLKSPPVDCVSVWFKKNPLLSTWSTMED